MGRKQGANPAEWFGVLGAVLLEDIARVEKSVSGIWTGLSDTTRDGAQSPATQRYELGAG